MNQHNINIVKGFAEYITLERSMSANSVEAYTRDVDKLLFYTESVLKDRDLEQVTTDELAAFIEWIARIGMKPRSQARILSAVKQLYRYMMFEDMIEDTPAATIQCPKMGMMLPNVLSVEEIDQIEGAIDLSTNEGERNRAIIETLYSCGLRVSELINLKTTDINPEEGFIKVTGKGNKTRLVPISHTALEYINYYVEKMRNHIAVNNENKDYLFLNRRGQKLTRVMIFTIIKRLVEITGIDKNVSPHTFRHSFATHLVEGGADLRAVQEMLGHESIQTTEIYTHLDSSYLRDEILTFHPRSDKRQQILDVTENLTNDIPEQEEQVDIEQVTQSESQEEQEEELQDVDDLYASSYPDETDDDETDDDILEPNYDIIDAEDFDDVEELMKMKEEILKGKNE